MGTFREIEEYWSMEDVLDAIDYLDFKDDVQAYEHEKAKAKSR